MKIEQQVEVLLETFMNYEGIDTKLREPDYVLSIRCMNFKTNPNHKSIRELLREMENRFTKGVKE